ncbi:MAG: TIR domain-containing protein [Gammaproteobacteria bacterium]|nr:TIR domain-containing protein [Gammaproteobacteria bacterium]
MLSEKFLVEDHEWVNYVRNIAELDLEQQLISSLTHEFCRILRYKLDQTHLAHSEYDNLRRYPEKIRVLISHSKHNTDGERIGKSMRDWIHAHGLLNSFFDIYDIPSGQSFEDTLLHEDGAGALVAIHTDSYSSREWCRREINETKRRQVPMIVIDCLRDADPRAMPYFGNVPAIRMDPDRMDGPDWGNCRLSPR